MMSDAKGPVKACVDVLCSRTLGTSHDLEILGSFMTSRDLNLSHWYFKMILILVERFHKKNSC